MEESPSPGFNALEPGDEENILYFVEERLSGSGAHDLLHTLRVVELATMIGGKEGADLKVVRASAYLHDTGRPDEFYDRKIDHAERSAEYAWGVLKGLGWDHHDIGSVCTAIKNHRYRNGAVPESLEGKVLQDADRIDALGAIGLVRLFTYGGARNRPDYERTDPFCRSRPPADDDYSMDHIYEKLFKLPNTLHTQTAVKVADERVVFMRIFLDQLEKDIGMG